MAQMESLIWVVNQELELLSFNQEFINFCTKNFHIKPKYKQSILHILTHSFGTSINWETRYKETLQGTTQIFRDIFYIDKVEQIYEMKFYPIKNPKTDEIQGVSVTAKDASESSRVANLLKIMENKHLAILNAMPDVILVHDVYGNCLEVLQGKYSEINYERSILIGKNITQLLPREDAENILYTFQDVINNDFLGELEYKRKINSNTYYFESRIVKLDDQQVISFIRNITERKKRQRKIAMQNKKLKKLNHELDNIVYKASHDLRSPLTSIMGLINLLKIEQEEEFKQKYIDAMEKSVYKLDGFIQDIINLSKSKKQKLKIEKIDFEQLIEQILNDVSHIAHKEHIKKNIHIELEKDFYNDKQSLQIILSNLIGNAIKYSKVDRFDSFIQITVSQVTENTVLLRLEDNGIGIDAKHLPHIFEMFYRATDSQAGSGLGLYIVKEACKKIKAQIQVKSIQHTGTTFEIILQNLEVK